MIDERDNPIWKAASNGAGKRHWGVARFAGREWATTSKGAIRWFATQAAAQKYATALNADMPAA